VPDVARFRKKPVVIEAWRFNPGKFNWPDWISKLWLAEVQIQQPGGYIKRGETVLSIPTLEGTMTAKVGDWIIRGVKGEVYPCKPDIFEATYELAAPNVSSESSVPDGEKEKIQHSLDTRVYFLEEDATVLYAVPDGYEQECLKQGTRIWLARWTEDQLEDARRRAIELHNKLRVEPAPNEVSDYARGAAQERERCAREAERIAEINDPEDSGDFSEGWWEGATAAAAAIRAQEKP
jgi:hypothetical protein